MALAIGIFAGALALIATERIDRTKIVLLGAVLLLLTQTIDQEHAIASVDFNTIGLLAGMMLMVRLTETTGVYAWVAIKAGQLSRGRPLAVVASLAVTTALLSAFLDNLTTVLLMVPITFLLADTLDVDPVPLVIIEIVASNIGGTATLIGDPPNILIAGATDLSFSAFLVNLAPIAAIAFVVVCGALYLAYRHRLRVAPEARTRVLELEARRSITDPDELRRTVPILVATILVFFFMGLFVMVGALEHTGAIGEVADGIAALTGGDRTAELLGIAWVSAIGSGIVDNIPFTAAMIPVVEQLGAEDAHWWALALGACFGGNATIVAAAANVAASGLAERAGRPVGFMTFLKAGLPATLLSMLLATGYIALRYL